MAIHFKDLIFEGSKDVYQPSEDSFLLAEHTQDIGELFLDVGCGCGIQSICAAERAKKVVGVDINPSAVELSNKNAILNSHHNCEFFQSDLFECVSGRFDTIVFNPPYVASDEQGALESSWAGGKDGMEITSRFLEGLSDYLNPSGRCYILISSQNDLEEVKNKIKQLGFRHRILGTQSFFFERLYVLELVL